MLNLGGHRRNTYASEQAMRYVRDKARIFRENFGRPIQPTPAMEKFEDDAQVEYGRLFRTLLPEEQFEEISLVLFKRLFQRSRRTEQEQENRDSFFLRHPEASRNYNNANNPRVHQSPLFAGNGVNNAGLPCMNLIDFYFMPT